MKAEVREAIAIRAREVRATPDAFERALEAARKKIEIGMSDAVAVAAGWRSLRLDGHFAVNDDGPRVIGVTDMDDDGCTIIVGADRIRLTHKEAEALQVALYGYGYERDAMLTGRHAGDDENFPW